MKHIIILSFVLAVFALVFPILMALDTPADDFSKSPPEIPDTPGSANISPADKTETPVSSFDASYPITLLDGDKTIAMTMEDFLIGSVSAEMPAGFDSEALMAQSVSLRTYALYKMQHPSSAHSEDICSDSSCCAAWKSEDSLREKWGEDYDKYIQKIYSAVTATDGAYLSYEDSPILAAFHSSSAGITESSDAVWSEKKPYLISVTSPETAEDVPNYDTVVTLLATDFTQTVKKKFPNADFSGAPEKWISGAVYDASGRLKSVRLGGVEIKGTELRSLFSLRSTAVDITYSKSDNTVVMSVTGYGHGVGMSQYGANVMAETGSDWQEILTWYYPGTTLENMKETGQN